MQQIHHQFFVTLIDTYKPIDKANDNVSFIYKRFQLEVLLKKLGFSRIEQTECIETYKRQYFIDQEIINKH